MGSTLRSTLCLGSRTCALTLFWASAMRWTHRDGLTCLSYLASIFYWMKTAGSGWLNAIPTPT
jgi:hypothetical protein